jgi:carboxyl-terminal processing protease
VLLENGYRGVGIGFSETLTGIYASTLTPKGPAERSGRIEPGDRLIAIGETSVEPLCFPDVMNRLRRAKSPVRLSFSNGKSQYSVLLEKVALEAKGGRLAVSYEPTDKGIFAKLSLPSFYESDQMSAAHDIRFALRNLMRQGDIRGVVLDLRENPGGFLAEGVRVAGTFMHSGIVARAACRGSREQLLRDLSCQQFYKGPLVLLVSKASASCSEIVAGALQDYGLAVIVGDAHTFGKATIQDQTMSTSRTSSYRVTMGRYTTVSGRSPQIEGVIPDIVVPTHYHKTRIGERYLAYPLAGANGPPLFKDPLSDVHPSKRSWLRSRYLPTIQKREVIWDRHMDKLRAQSHARLAASEAYQAFLENPASAREDLVMREAIEILKDMNRIVSGTP